MDYFKIKFYQKFNWRKRNWSSAIYWLHWYLTYILLAQPLCPGAGPENPPTPAGPGGGHDGGGVGGGGGGGEVGRGGWEGGGGVGGLSVPLSRGAQRIWNICTFLILGQPVWLGFCRDCPRMRKVETGGGPGRTGAWWSWRFLAIYLYRAFGKRAQKFKRQCW